MDEGWNKLVTILTDTVNATCPLVNPCKQIHVPWATKENLRELKLKCKLYRCQLLTGTSADEACYQQQAKKFKSLFRKARGRHERRIMNGAKKNPKKFYAYIRRNKKVRAAAVDLVAPNGDKASTDVDRARVLADFFSSVYTREEDSPDRLGNREIPEAKLEWVEITTRDVLTALKNVKVDKSPGPDGLPAVLFKRLAEELSFPLTYLFRKSLHEGKLPEQWKVAHVTAL